MSRAIRFIAHYPMNDADGFEQELQARMLDDSFDLNIELQARMQEAIKKVEAETALKPLLIYLCRTSSITALFHDLSTVRIILR